MLPFIYLRLKRTDETDFVGPFIEYVSRNMCDDPSRYEDALQRLTQLRNNARDVTKDMTGIGVLWKYRIQVESLDLRLPEFSVPFMWYDSLSGKPNLERHLNYEKACILFNVAALFSQMGEKQDRESDDGLKRGFHYFQCSGSMFSYIYEKFSHAPTLDLGKEALSCLKNLMLAQAQECFLAKGIRDERKPSILAKMASQLAYMYLQLYEQLKKRKLWSYEEQVIFHERLSRSQKFDAILYPGTLLVATEEMDDKKRDKPKDTIEFETNWIVLTQNKFLYYTMMMLYYAAMDCLSKEEIGEGIARLEKAELYSKELIQLLDHDVQIASSTMSTMHDVWQTIKNKVVGTDSLITEALRHAVKDNDFIYHQKVPVGESLMPVEKLEMTQVLNLGQIEKEIMSSKTHSGSSNTFESDLIEDYFRELMPLHIHEKASLYSEEKAKIFRAICKEVEESDAALDVALESMEMTSVFNEMRKVIDFGKKPEGVFEMHFTSQASSTDRFPSFVVWELFESISRKCQNHPSFKSLIGDIQRNFSTLESFLRDCRDLISKDDRDHEEGKTLFTVDWRQLPLENRSGTLQQLTEVDTDLKVLFNRFTRLDPLENDEVFLEALTSRKTFESYCQNLRESLEMNRNVGDLLGGTYDEASLNRMESSLWDLVQLGPKRKLILKECKDLNLQDDISSILLMNQGKEDFIVEHELKKYGPFQGELQDMCLFQDQLLASLSRDYQDFIATRQNATSRNLSFTLEDSLKKRLKTYETQYETLISIRGNQRPIQQTSEILHRKLQNLVDQRTKERQKLSESLQSDLSQRQLRGLLSRYQEKPSNLVPQVEEVTRKLQELETKNPKPTTTSASSQHASPSLLD